RNGESWLGHRDGWPEPQVIGQGRWPPRTTQLVGVDDLNVDGVRRDWIHPIGFDRDEGDEQPRAWEPARRKTCGYLIEPYLAEETHRDPFVGWPLVTRRKVGAATQSSFTNRCRLRRQE